MGQYDLNELLVLKTQELTTFLIFQKSVSILIVRMGGLLYRVVNFLES